MNLNKTINYEKVPAPQMRRSVIPIPFKNDLTAPMSFIIPVFVQDVLPGTSVKMRSAAQIRLLRPFKVPMFDYMKAQFFWFFTPYRVLSAEFERFIGGSNSGIGLGAGTSSGLPGDWNVDAKGDLALPPFVNDLGVEGITGDKLVAGSIFDYMGIPVPKPEYQTNQYYFHIKNTMPFRAYNMIFNEYFRDENLQGRMNFDYNSNVSDFNHYYLKSADKTRDYFTTALIKPQKSNPVEVTLISEGGLAPIGGTIVGRVDNTDISGVGALEFETVGGSPETGAVTIDANGTVRVNDTPQGLKSGLKLDSGVVNNDLSGAFVELSGISGGISLNNLRTLVQVNKWTERLAIGGSRYGEVVQAFFGTNPGDKRLQVPEFLGVGTIDVNVQEVVQTTGEGVDLGVTGARSNSVSGAGSWFKSFSEHGVLMCLMVIRQKQNTYQQGLPRMYNKSTRLDLYWPTFAFISYQPILNKEIYFDPTNVKDQKNEEVFGYQMPYQEHRTMPNQVHGDLLTNSGEAPLDFWNFADYFDTLPTLGSDFIRSHTNNLNRALLGEQTSARPFVVNFRVNADWTLPMPVNAMPGLMDHF